jgi:hypothetical protein
LWLKCKVAIPFRQIILCGLMRGMKFKLQTMSRLTDMDCKSPAGGCWGKWIRKNFRCWTTCASMWCLLLSGVALQTSPWAHGAEPSAAKGATSNPAPTTITSRTMTVSNQANTAIFDGAVVLTRGLLVVHSDHMVVSFHPNRNGADSKNANGATKPKNNSSASKPEPQGWMRLPRSRSVVSGWSKRRAE